MVSDLLQEEYLRLSDYSEGTSVLSHTLRNETFKISQKNLIQSLVLALT